MKIKLSRSQWEGIGKKAGWMKKAQAIDNDLELTDSKVPFESYNVDKSTPFGQYVSSVEKGVKAMQSAKSEEEKQAIAKRIPHFTLVTGKPGTGKSMWAEALANLLKNKFVTIYLSDLLDKWGAMGKMEANSSNLIQNILSAKNVVVLIDEIDSNSDINDDRYSQERLCQTL